MLRSLMALAALALQAQQPSPSDYAPIRPAEADIAILGAYELKPIAWDEYKYVKRQLWAGGVASPMVKAIRADPKGQGLDPRRTVAEVEAFYRQPSLSAVITAHGMTPHTFAVWEKAVVHYSIIATFARRLPGRSYATIHDRNMFFMMDRLDELARFNTEVMGFLDQVGGGED